MAYMRLICASLTIAMVLVHTPAAALFDRKPADNQPLLDYYEGRSAKMDVAAHQAKRLSDYSGKERDARELFLVDNDIAVADLPTLQAKANAVIARLLGVWKGAPISAQVYVTAAEQLEAVNYQNGVIIISAETFRTLQTEDQLAFILAHELGHSIAGHDTQGMVSGALGMVSRIASQSMLLQPMISSGRWTQMLTPEELAVDRRVASKKLLVASLAAEALAADVLQPAHSRKQELEADIIGFDLLRRAGYVSDQSQNALSKIPDVIGRSSARLQKSQELVTLLVSDQVQNLVKPSGQLGGWITKMANAVSGEALQRMFVQLQKGFKDHPNSETRQQNLNDYIAKAYETAEPQAAVRKTAMKYFDDKKLQPLFEGSRKAASLNLTLASAGSMSTEKPPAALESVPLTRYVRGKLEQLGGRVQDAEREWSLAIRSQWATKSQFRRLASLYVEANDPANAQKVATQARTAFRDSDIFRAVDIQAHLLRGDQAKAERSAVECATKAEAEEALECRLVLGYDIEREQRTAEGVLAASTMPARGVFRKLKRSLLEN